MTPEQLRELEKSLAFEQATSSIDSNCVCVEPAGEGDDGWYDLGSADIDFGDEAEYLEARGLLKRHPSHPAWVMLLDEDDEAQP